MSSELVSHGRLDTGTNKKLMAGYQRLSQAGAIDRTAYKQETKEMLAYMQHIFTCERCKAIYHSHDTGFCGCMIRFCNPTQYKYVMMMMMMICVRRPLTQFWCVSCKQRDPKSKSNALNVHYSFLSTNSSDLSDRDIPQDVRIQHAWVDDKFRPIHVQADIPRDRIMDRSSENKSDERTAKLYWPEESCERESDVLDKIYGIVESEPQALQDATALFGNSYIIVFRELRPITELTGKEFLKAWWDAVQCHRVLWKKGVYHHEVAPSNMIYYRTANGKLMTVLNDYDLLSITDDGPSGNERTGTVPFMAIYLLSQKALRGEVKHSYQHDVESFIWVLTWVCLRYDAEGKLRTDLTNRPLEEWLKADAGLCRKEKHDFLGTGRNGKATKPSSAYADIWEGVQCCLDVVLVAQGRHKRAALDVDVVFTTWLEEPLRAYL